MSHLKHNSFVAEVFRPQIATCVSSIAFKRPIASDTPGSVGSATWRGAMRQYLQRMGSIQQLCAEVGYICILLPIYGIDLGLLNSTYYIYLGVEPTTSRLVTNDLSVSYQPSLESLHFCEKGDDINF